MRGIETASPPSRSAGLDARRRLAVPLLMEGGGNRAFRHRYAAHGSGNGFGPYGLTGLLNLGWLGLVGLMPETEYETRLTTPLFTADVIGTVVGPNTSRIRNVLESTIVSSRALGYQ